MRRRDYLYCVIAALLFLAVAFGASVLVSMQH
jgi:hypothetical protein